jgi:putative oxidoreductase
MDFTSLGLLILRVALGLDMALVHGLPKLLGFTSKMGTFPDPLGLGSTLSLSLAVGAEFLCAIALVLGVFTRIVSVPLILTMATAFFVFHRFDTWDHKELAFLFLVGFTTLFCTGAGRYSVDAIFRGVK